MGNQESKTPEEVNFERNDNDADEKPEKKIEWEEALNRIRGLNIHGLSEKVLQSSLRALQVDNQPLYEDELNALVALFKLRSSAKFYYKGSRFKRKSVRTDDDSFWIKNEGDSEDSKSVEASSSQSETIPSPKTKNTLNNTGEQAPPASSQRRKSLKTDTWVNNKREYTEEELKNLEKRQENSNNVNEKPIESTESAKESETQSKISNKQKKLQVQEAPTPLVQRKSSLPDNCWISNEVNGGNGFDDTQPATMEKAKAKPNQKAAIEKSSTEVEGKIGFDNVQVASVEKTRARADQTAAIERSHAHQNKDDASSTSKLDDQCWINNKVEYTEEQLAALESARQSIKSPSIGSPVSSTSQIIEVTQNDPIDVEKNEHLSQTAHLPAQSNVSLHDQHRIGITKSSEDEARAVARKTFSESLDDACWINNKIEYTEEELAAHEMERLEMKKRQLSSAAKEPDWIKPGVGGKVKVDMSVTGNSPSSSVWPVVTKDDRQSEDDSIDQGASRTDVEISSEENSPENCEVIQTTTEPEICEDVQTATDSNGRRISITHTLDDHCWIDPMEEGRNCFVRFNSMDSDAQDVDGKDGIPATANELKILNDKSGTESNDGFSGKPSSQNENEISKTLNVHQNVKTSLLGKDASLDGEEVIENDANFPDAEINVQGIIDSRDSLSSNVESERALDEISIGLASTDKERVTKDKTSAGDSENFSCVMSDLPNSESYDEEVVNDDIYAAEEVDNIKNGHINDHAENGAESIISPTQKSSAPEDNPSAESCDKKVVKGDELFPEVNCDENSRANECIKDKVSSAEVEQDHEVDFVENSHADIYENDMVRGAELGQDSKVDCRENSHANECAKDMVTVTKLGEDAEVDSIEISHSDECMNDKVGGADLGQDSKVDCVENSHANEYVNDTVGWTELEQENGVIGSCDDDGHIQDILDRVSNKLTTPEKHVERKDEVLIDLNQNGDSPQVVSVGVAEEDLFWTVAATEVIQVHIRRYLAKKRVTAIRRISSSDEYSCPVNDFPEFDSTSL